MTSSHSCTLPPLTCTYLHDPEELDIVCTCGAMWVATETEMPPPLRYQWRKARWYENVWIRWSRWTGLRW